MKNKCFFLVYKLQGWAPKAIILIGKFKSEYTSRRETPRNRLNYIILNKSAGRKKPRCVIGETPVYSCIFFSLKLSVSESKTLPVLAGESLEAILCRILLLELINSVRRIREASISCS